jgi:hypothetical protein
MTTTAYKFFLCSDVLNDLANELLDEFEEQGVTPEFIEDFVIEVANAWKEDLKNSLGCTQQQTVSKLWDMDVNEDGEIEWHDRCDDEPTDDWPDYEFNYNGDELRFFQPPIDDEEFFIKIKTGTFGKEDDEHFDDLVDAFEAAEFRWSDKKVPTWNHFVKHRVHFSKDPNGWFIFPF